jgi:hypothetical protein
MIAYAIVLTLPLICSLLVMGYMVVVGDKHID